MPILSREHVASLSGFRLGDVDTNRLQLLDYQQRMDHPLPILLVPHFAPEGERSYADKN